MFKTIYIGTQQIAILTYVGSDGELKDRLLVDANLGPEYSLKFSNPDTSARTNLCDNINLIMLHVVVGERLTIENGDDLTYEGPPMMIGEAELTCPAHEALTLMSSEDLLDLYRRSVDSANNLFALDNPSRLPAVLPPIKHVWEP